MAPIFTGSKFGFGSGPSGPSIVIAPISATGGTKTTIGSYTYHDFTTPGPNPFVVTGGPYPANILLVAGGGGGSGGPPADGGQSGGGAGGVIIAPLFLDAGSFTIQVGGGGQGGNTPGQPFHGANGGNSTFGPNWVAQGGGGGSYYTPSPNTTQGGSPGGLYGGTISPLNQTNNPALPADSRTFGYGNQGATNGGFAAFGGGGGGGAGGAGNIGRPAGPGTGGIGLPTAPLIWLTGTPFFSPTSQYFAGGGGTGSREGASSGGTGGGGRGADAPGTGNTPGTTNTGSGGGGGSSGGSGGPGRVIIAYLT